MTGTGSNLVSKWCKIFSGNFFVFCNSDGWSDILPWSICLSMEVPPLVSATISVNRLNSKSGRIRGSLEGKRVDFSARSVITGDPNLSIRQLGVPLKIAKNLTKPIVVNDRNRDYLMTLIQNGPDEYPGAKILKRKTRH